ncbi:TPA: class I SAM-dependent DNA methyltransferase, partial [Streptococcus agalactiae]
MKILDHCAGSGAFLVKAMANMIKEVGGVNTKEAEDIKQNKLYGIEFDREIFALACANMLIHKDGKTNLEQFDTREKEACKWIKSKNITKVLMNPPYERKYGCKKIVTNVLDNVPAGIKCAFILPDKKLEKDRMHSLLKKHTLDMIIKLPEKLFDAGVTTSVFVFETGKPQKDKKIFACYMEDDGLERVKNQGRHDIKNKWKEIEKYWLEVARTKVDTKYNTHQWIDSKEYLS